MKVIRLHQGITWRKLNKICYTDNIPFESDGYFWIRVWDSPTLCGDYYVEELSACLRVLLND